MRVCSVCGVEKVDSDFFYRNKTKDQRHRQCKTCYIERRKKLWRDYYYRRGGEYRIRAVERNRKIKQNIRKSLFIYLKGQSCKVCGISDPRVLEFDHIDSSTKSFSIAHSVTMTLSWDKILNEISKCQVLCANCHRIKTAQEQNWYKNKRHHVI